jgi:hypothetical protein
MLIGIPTDFDHPSKEPTTWLDGAGIYASNELALFDLRQVSVERSG